VNVYASSSFPSCADLSEESNQCYEVVVNSRSDAVVIRRDGVKDWEDRTNDCVEYTCDNESGFNVTGKCLNKDGVNYVCTSDNECVESDVQIEDGKTIVIQIKPVDSEDVNISKIVSIVSNLTGIDREQMKITIEIDERGRVVRILIYVQDRKTAEIIAKKVDEITIENCVYVLCQKIRVDYNYSLSLSEDSKDLLIAEAPHVDGVFASVLISLMVLIAIALQSA